MLHIETLSAMMYKRLQRYVVTGIKNLTQISQIVDFEICYLAYFRMILQLREVHEVN